MTLTIPNILALLRDNLRVTNELVSELERILVGQNSQPVTGRRGRGQIDELVRELERDDSTPVLEAAIRADLDGMKLRKQDMSSEELRRRRLERNNEKRKNKPKGYNTNAAKAERIEERKRILAKLPRVFTEEQLEAALGVSKLDRAMWTAQTFRAGLIDVVEPGRYRRKAV